MKAEDQPFNAQAAIVSALIATQVATLGALAKKGHIDVAEFDRVLESLIGEINLEAGGVADKAKSVMLEMMKLAARGEING